MEYISTTHGRITFSNHRCYCRWYWWICTWKTTSKRIGPYVAKLGRKAFNAVKTYGKKIAKKVTQKKVITYCFIAGTHILAEDGKVPIEDIKIGDWVYVENPETGEIKLKPVVQTFESETYELVHITINGEEIITTPGHPFYVVGKGWIGADRLTTNDNVLLYNQKDVTVESARVEHLKESITVYNFEVDDYHT